MAEPLALRVDEAMSVSALLDAPENARALYVFAHGAGAGMAHRSMSDVASGLAARGIGSLRYQFGYMERGSKRPDPPKLAHAVVRAAVAEAQRFQLPLFAGGRSFGGRMTSQAQAIAPLANVRGLIFLGFPLHPAGKPSIERAEHLGDVHVPMLFLQGTRDELASLDLLAPIVNALAPRAELKLFEGADHSFHVQARSGRTDAQVREAMLDAMAAWIDAHSG
ncbi:MAG TPA: alpha/beta family hydrolase [Caulobacterales bacterium]|nr:alpha/beta family hydrolase [Caulobacterales bacterium]